MTPLGIRLDAWAMMAVVVALFAATAVLWRRRRSLAIGTAISGTVLGLLFLYWVSMNAFCVPPPGSACA